jgi:hypothetical protein
MGERGIVSNVEKERGRLLRQLVSGLPRPLPTDPMALIELLRGRMERIVGRPVELRVEYFPQDTASGFWVRLPDRDIVIVEATARPDHRLVIFGHELWHMHVGECKAHASPEDVTAAARSIGNTDPELAQALLTAARAACDEQEEKDAEHFGLHLASQLRKLIREENAPLDDLSRRIHTSLGWNG